MEGNNEYKANSSCDYTLIHPTGILNNIGIGAKGKKVYIPKV